MKNSKTLIKFVVKLGILFLVFWGVLKAISGDSLGEVSEMPIWKAALAIAAIATLLDFIMDKFIPADSKLGSFLSYR